MKLYELTARYKRVLDLAEELDEGTLKDTLESIDDEIEEKADNVAKINKTLEAEVQGLKEEERRLSNRRKAIENNIVNLKRILEEQMILLDKKKIKTNLFSFNIQKNAPSVRTIDETKIPLDYAVEQPVKFDKKAILNDLKNGVEVDGVELQQTESLRIR